MEIFLESSLSELQIAENKRWSNAEKRVVCLECGQCFRKESAKFQNNFVIERNKPVSEQAGAVQCTVCKKWFRSRGGCAVNRCLLRNTQSTFPLLLIPPFFWEDT